jgi:hypothetical protein
VACDRVPTFKEGFDIPKLIPSPQRGKGKKK